MTIKIDYQRAKNLLREVINEVGRGFIYSDANGHKSNPELSVSCSYVHGDTVSGMTPGCIVGRALCKAGLPVQLLATITNGSIGNVVQQETSKSLFEITPAALILFQTAQALQDRGTPYGVIHDLLGSWAYITEHLRKLDTFASEVDQ